MLKITHNAGFFSCCIVKLINIINYFNDNKKLPGIIDSSSLFELYRPNYLEKYDDITYHFFDKNNSINKDNNINYINYMNYNTGIQFNNYNNIDYNPLIPFINKYFTPNIDIINIQNNLLNKYNINTDEYCGVYYRGTDKFSETIIGTYDTYIDKMNEIKQKDNKIKFIIQSDEENFIKFIKEKEKYKDSIIFIENIKSTSNKGIHYEHTSNENYLIIKNFFAILLILSKCKYIICSSSNCSIWMMFYRNNGNNVYQFLNNIWL